jgi:hypothetical protein
VEFLGIIVRENTKANALSRHLDFMNKEDKTKTLFKKGSKGLEYSSKVVTIYKVIEDLTTKQRIQNVYKGDAKVQIAKA